MVNSLAAIVLLVALAAPFPAWAQAKHVVHVSVDGLSGLLLEARLKDDDSGRYPNFRRLMDEGASTFNARTDYFSTSTLPNHVSMTTGRPVLQPADRQSTIHHGWTANDDPLDGETLHNAGNPNLDYVASVFDVVHDRGLSTALFASKKKFVLFERSYDTDSGAPDRVGSNDGTRKIDYYVEDRLIQDSLLKQMAAHHYSYAFVHFREPDTAGHAHGWGSPEWDAAVQRVDKWIGQMLELIENDADLSGRSVLLVSADHGGRRAGHGEISKAANYTIPFFVWGAGVEPNADLYELNPMTRRDPGKARPSYDARPQPIRNGDGANLALELLGLPPIPGSTINADQDLSLVRSSQSQDLERAGEDSID